jgi:hypothetical protein
MSRKELEAFPKEPTKRIKTPQNLNNLSQVLKIKPHQKLFIFSISSLIAVKFKRNLRFYLLFTVLIAKIILLL